MTKRESLTRLNTEFMRSLARALNGNYNASSYNYSGMDRERLLDLLSGKLTVDEVTEIRRHYLLCHSAQEAAQAVSPDGVKDIQNTVQQYFGKEALFEVKVGKRTCDMVFPDGILAIEIKSARDKPSKAVEQIQSYKQWTDQVYLAYDETLHDRIPQEIEENGAGLLKYVNSTIEQVKSPKHNPTPSAELLTFMTYQALSAQARQYNVPSTGGKDVIARRLADEISTNEARHLFKQYLKSRS